MTSAKYTPTGIPLAQWARGLQKSALQEMLTLASRPGIISLALGLPSPELFPKAEISQALSRVLSTDSRALQYGPPFEPLKTHIVALMKERGVRVSEEQIFLTTGAQQGMSLIARLLLNSDGVILCEEMTYTGFQQAVQPMQPRMLTVPTDPQSGIDVEAVEFLLKRGGRPAFIYTVTDGHNPLSVSMAREKRLRLIDLARNYKIPIVEDDVYGLLYYEKPVPPLRSFDEENVIYIGSFSKIMAPGLRVGWILAPVALMPALSIIKEASDIDTSTLTQRALSSYFDTFDLGSRLETLRGEYRSRRNVMLECLGQLFPEGSHWLEPLSGFFIWVELPKRIDTGQLFKLAVEREQVAFIPGQAFAVEGKCQSTNCLRLNFSHPNTDQIKEAMMRLGRVLENQYASI